MPAWCAASMMWWESSSVVCGPKFIVPRTRRETFRPDRPRCVYSMLATLRRTRPHVQQVVWMGLRALDDESRQCPSGTSADDEAARLADDRLGDGGVRAAHEPVGCTGHDPQGGADAG